MIFACSSKSKADEIVEVKPSASAVTDEEIKNLPLEELLSLKSSITNYLKCRKLKNKNNEFITLYLRINKEIGVRTANGVTVKKQIFETKVDKSPLTTARKMSSATSTTNNSVLEEKPKNLFLRKKFSFSQSLHDIKFPSFLNDKNEKVVVSEKKKIADFVEKTEEASQPSSEIFDEEKPKKTFKSSVNKTKKCLKDFDKGLFNQKIDVNNDDILINFMATPKMGNLKENEIKRTLFNEVPEDLFFELE